MTTHNVNNHAHDPYAVPYYTSEQAATILGFSPKSTSTISNYVRSGDLIDIDGHKPGPEGTTPRGGGRKRYRLDVQSVLRLRDRRQQEAIEHEREKREKAERAAARIVKQRHASEDAHASTDVLADILSVLRSIDQKLDSTPMRDADGEWLREIVTKAIRDVVA